MNKIAAVVVLYNPEMHVIDNILSYSNQVDKIFAIDNSENINPLFVTKINSIAKVEYTSNGANLGIATALNAGANNAMLMGFEYLLTMDQDSEAIPDMISNLLECYSVDSKIALVSPLIQHNKGKNVELNINAPCKQVFTAWTSGSLVKLKALQIIGGYNEDFFIDYVDHEFCLKLNKIGFKVYQCDKTFIKHNLGEIEEINLFFRKVYTTNHSSIRLYYRIRNRFYLKKKYKKIFPEFFKQDDIEFWKSLLKVILFEQKKLIKIKMMIIGYLDYRKSKNGKFNRNTK